MLKPIATFLLVILFASTHAQDADKIQWMSWDEAMEARKKNPKKIFIDIYTDWCGWCKKMDASTFKDPNVVKYMNENYYAVKLDAEMKDTITYQDRVFINPVPNPPKGKRRGTHTLAASLLDSKMSYPSYVVFDENMNRIHVIKGYKKVEPLLGILLFFGTNSHISYTQYYYNTNVKPLLEKKDKDAN